MFRELTLECFTQRGYPKCGPPHHALPWYRKARHTNWILSFWSSSENCGANGASTHLAASCAAIRASPSRVTSLFPLPSCCNKCKKTLNTNTRNWVVDLLQFLCTEGYPVPQEHPHQLMYHLPRFLVKLSSFLRWWCAIRVTGMKIWFKRHDGPLDISPLVHELFIHWC